MQGASQRTQNIGRTTDVYQRTPQMGVTRMQTLYKNCVFQYFKITNSRVICERLTHHNSVITNCSLIKIRGHAKQFLLTKEKKK